MMKDELSLLQHPAGRATRALRVLILVDKVDAPTVATVEYALSLGPERVSGIHVAFSEARAARAVTSWNARYGTRAPLLTVEPVNRRLCDSLSPVVNSELPDAHHPVVIFVPEGRRFTSLFRPHRRDQAGLAEAFEDVADVWVVRIAAA